MNSLKKLFQNSSGSSMLQVFVIGAILAGAGAYMLSGIQRQNKVVKTAALKGSYAVLKKELTEALADSKVCEATLKHQFENPIEHNPKADELTRMNVPGIKGMVNTEVVEMYSLGQELYGLNIKEMQLIMPEGYVASDDMRMLSADLAVFVESAAAKKGVSTSYGGRDIALKVPLYLFMLNKKITSCLSVDAQTILNALRDACAKLGGNWDESAGICRDLHGENGRVFKDEVAKDFCSPDNSSCDSHPYAGVTCQNPALQVPEPLEKDKGNWVLSGFNSEGNPVCSCVPVKACEDPTQYCKGTDLGTDWCYNDCGEGIKEDEHCAACTPGAWTPDPSTYCGVRDLTDGCGGIRANVPGTQAEVWSPEASTICMGDTFTQTSSCGSPSRQSVGTKDCSCTIPSSHSWSENILGKSYTCTGLASQTSLSDNSNLSVPSSVSSANQGSVEYFCDEGTLRTISQKCSPLPKTLDCSITYQYKNNGKAGAMATNGAWSTVEHGAENNCEGSNDHCGLRVGVSCKGDANVRVSYQYKEFNTATPLQTTPWSTPDGITRWGGWSQMNLSHPKEECSRGRYCGVMMKAEADGGGTCTVAYQHRWRHGRSSENRNGVWSEGTYTNNDDDGCESGSNPCGIRATISCSIEGN